MRYLLIVGNTGPLVNGGNWSRFPDFKPVITNDPAVAASLLDGTFAACVVSLGDETAQAIWEIDDVVRATADVLFFAVVYNHQRVNVAGVRLERLNASAPMEMLVAAIDEHLNEEVY